MRASHGMSGSAILDWQRDVIDFWFGLEPDRHWRRDPALDAEIVRRFAALWEARKRQPAELFLAAPEAALAAIILFDQFPRNMFRGDPRAFATDPLARTISRAALDRGFDREVPEERRHFLYMPLQHSEDLSDQQRSVALFEQLGNEAYLDYARKHRDVIARFGRFPHRNEALGRTSTEEERAFGLKAPW